MNSYFVPSKVTISDAQGRIVDISNPMSIQVGDSPSADSFGRYRISQPTTIFDSKNLYYDLALTGNVENLPLFYDNQQISGSGTTTHYNINQASQDITVSGLTAGTRVRQTKMRFNYQPGKSQLILRTFNFHGGVSGVTKQIGYFDDYNGIYLELDGETPNIVLRTYTSGSVVNTKVSQSNWNVDKLNGTTNSNIALDFTKTQILLIDFEWLGVGRARIGFVIDGLIYYAHEFLNSNNLEVVYMSTPNLPLRTTISNDGTGVETYIHDICSSVISEGGSEDLGVIRYASTNGTEMTATSENIVYALMGIRLKTNYIGMSIKILTSNIQLQSASSKCEWFLVLNPTIAGAFTYAEESLSAVEIARGTSSNTVTGGYKIIGGFVESGGQQTGNAGSTTKETLNALLLGSKIDNTRDQIVLCIRPISGSSGVVAEGSLIWREIF